MQIEDFADLALDRVQRIERGHRLLEHHGDVVAAHLPQVALIGVEQLLRRWKRIEPVGWLAEG